jgi:hypothetical protein
MPLFSPALRLLSLFLIFFYLAESEKTYTVHSLNIQYPPVATEPTLPDYSNLLERIQKFNPDNVEFASRTFRETIQHFNFSDPAERNMVREH